MRYFILALSLFALVSCGGKEVQSPTAVEKVSSHDMLLQDIFWRSLYPKKQEQSVILFSTESFKPVPSDIAVLETDLNEDGRPDFIASIIHFKYFEKGTYPVFLMMQDTYGGYFRFMLDQRTANFDIKVLPEKSNGMQNLSIDGKVLIFDGKNYVSGL